MTLILFLSLAMTSGQLNRLKVPRPRVGSSKFSLNPLKPLMNLVRDPLRASAQRHYPKYLPPPPGMFQPIPAPARVSYSSLPPYRGYPTSRFMMPHSSMTMSPPLNVAPSSLVLSALVNDRYYGRPSNSMGLPSDLQIKAVRIPSRQRRPSSTSSNMNIADSVVRQLLDMPHHQEHNNNHHHQGYPSVLVIEDPDATASGSSSSAGSSGDLFADSLTSSQKHNPTILLSPPVHAEYADSSTDLSSANGSNPEVFVIVSKNSKSNKGGYYVDDKKSDILGAAGSSSKTMKKYKITSGLDEFGGSGSRQVWIIK